MEHLLCVRHFSWYLVYLNKQNEDLDTVRAYISNRNADNKHKHNKISELHRLLEAAYVIWEAFPNDGGKEE